MPTILIPTPLRPYTGGQAAVSVDSTTVSGALDALGAQWPDVMRHLRDDSGKLRSFVNIYLGDEDIRFLEGGDTAVEAGSELTIVPSIAGGVDTALTHEEVARYSRHLILEEVGLEGQQRL